MTAPRVDIMIPVLNEAHVLEASVEKVRAWLSAGFDYRWRIVIVDNGSVDGTGGVASRLSTRYEDVAFLHLDEPGRGRALRHAWLMSDADAVGYMDVDLSTDLQFLSVLFSSILAEGYDLAVGSRLLPESRTRRSPTREAVSRIYNLIVHIALGLPVSDAQCGFKALSRDAVRRLVPRVADDSWFFDTELLFLAFSEGMRIRDIPVEWVEDDDSRVKIMQTAWDDLKGIWRLRRQRAAARQARAVQGERTP
jgi:glycosyltransferase involved in cell wall biosynthesis